MDKKVENSIKDYFSNESLNRILKMLSPYKPKKFILGTHFTPPGVFLSNINPGQADTILTYRGIPIEISEDKYEIDFII